MATRSYAIALLALVLAAPAHAAEPNPHDPAPRLAAQREAMTPLARMDGQWRGAATVTLPNGQTLTNTQTERVGPLLDGTVKVIEGRSYDSEGKTVFNALAVVSYDPDQRSYRIRSYAMGRAGDFAFTPTADGFRWEMPAGPMTMRYTTTIKDGVWTEIGERIVPGQAPVRFIELRLQRVGDSNWPQAGAVAAR